MRALIRASPYQFAVVRWLLGIYLAIHFAHLVPWGAELFSNEGVLPDASTSPLAGLFPNYLAFFDSPASVTGFLTVLTLISLVFAAGVQRPVMALLLWYGWTCLFNRNLLISNPGLPYVGLMLVMFALLPPGEGLKPRAMTAAPGWRLPAWLWRTPFFVLMAGYTYSGLVKLGSPSWVNGEAIQHLLDGPLARPWFVRDILQSMPPVVLKVLTWGSLAAEILALPLCLFRRGQLIAWAALMCMHVGIATVVSFLDLTVGMVMIHLFVFHPAWLPGAKRDGLDRIVFFDGVCALCDGAVRLLLEEDGESVLSFAPLQGGSAARILPDEILQSGIPGTIIYQRGDRAYDKSQAALWIARDLGGFWAALSLLRLVPKPWRDAAYDFVATRRYRWFGKFEACRLPRQGEAERFMD